jgi:3-dehydroquinate synthase
MTSVRVAHAGADYEVVIGELAEALPSLRSIAGERRLPLISDGRVLALHGEKLAAIAVPDPILVPEGEAAKNWVTLQHIVEQLARLQVKRGTPILLLGGGSVGDVGGLAASLFKRGCPAVHIPTTLLAQVDSAIGGKTAIDAAGQKNLVGAFHHPLLVFADPALLETLDDRQLRSGYAEVVKYGLIDDPAFFAWCEANWAGVIDCDPAARLAAVEHCIRAKARIVASDPDDSTGHRALLNLGHTFGHAIEALAGEAVVHGEAVAVGLCLAFQFSANLGLSPAEDFQRVRDHLATAGLPVSLRDVGLSGRTADLVELMGQDKKAGATGPALVLVRGIGQAFLKRGVDPGLLARFLGGAD